MWLPLVSLKNVVEDSLHPPGYRPIAYAKNGSGLIPLRAFGCITLDDLKRASAPEDSDHMLLRALFSHGQYRIF